MIEVDESPSASETVARPASSPFGMVRAAIDSVREKWNNKEHRAPVLFTVSSFWLSLTGMLAGVAVVHYIGPSDLGLWSSVALIQTYAAFALAGVQNGLSRELPYYFGANNEGMARSLASTTLFYTFAICAFAVLGGIGGVGYLVLKHADPRLIYAVVTVTLLVLVKFYQSYLFITFRSKNSFAALATVQIWQGVVILCSLPLIILGYDGMLTRLVVIGGVALYLMHRARPMSVSPVWKTESFMLLFKTGIPIFATDYVANCAGTFDKVALLKFSGVENVGLYSLALTASATLQVIPQSIAHYIYPRMSHHYGRTNNPRVLWGMAWKITLIIVGTMLPIAVVGWFAFPPAIRILFPKYIGGTHAAQILLFAVVANGATTGVNALLSLKAWAYLITYQLSYALFLVVAPFVGIRFATSPLDGVAYGMLVANVLGAILAIVTTYMAIHRTPNVPGESEPNLSEEASKS